MCLIQVSFKMDGSIQVPFHIAADSSLSLVFLVSFPQQTPLMASMVHYSKIDDASPDSGESFQEQIEIVSQRSQTHSTRN